MRLGIGLGVCDRRGVSPPIPGLVTDGLLGCWTFTDGAGSTVLDRSGNGRHGSFPGGSNNPTWGASGLVFAGSTTQSSGQYVSLPFTSAELAAAVTWQWCRTQDTVNQGPTLSADTAGSLQLGTVWGWTKSATVCEPWTGFASNLTKTSGYDPAYGPEVVTVVRTSSGGDLLYLGSAATTKYTSATSSLGGGNTTSGTVWLGKSDATWNTVKSFTGTMHFLAVYSRALTPSEVTTNSAAIKAWQASLRGTSYPWTNPATTRQLLAVGDSNTYGFSSTSYFDSMTLAQTVSRYNFGITGLYVGEQNGHGMAYSLAQRQLPLVAPGAAWTGMVLMGGTNDMAASTTAATCFASLQGIISDFLAACAAKGATGKVAILPIPNFGPLYGDQTKQQGLNALIKAAYVDATVANVSSFDPATVAAIYATDAYLDSTYFQADQVHLKTAGHDLVAPKVAALVDAWG